MADPNVRHSKFMSLVLRHRPELIGLELDDAGWADVEALMAGAREQGYDMDLARLQDVVATCKKQRFALSDDGKRIRANQGHSVDVELGLEPETPPDRLYHGTVDASLASIRQNGLSKRARHHVHLSPDLETATVVGDRRGAAIVLVILAREMVAAGHEFFVSKNGVWLTDEVPPEFIRFPD